MLAIVIPYYNIKFFDKTLESLSNQTDKRFTVYIGDDNSPNNPEGVISKFASGLTVKYAKFEENWGSHSLVKQWERCIDLLQDEQWIMILGDDDVLDKNCVNYFYQNLDEIKQNDSKVIRFASQYIGSNGKPLANYYTYFHPKIEKATDSFYRKFLGQSTSSLSEHIFSRISFQKNRFQDYPLAWYSDDYAWLDFSGFKAIFTINEAIVSVRVSSESISGKEDNLELKNKAKKLFFKDLIYHELGYFNKRQKEGLLVEYDILLKDQQELDAKNAAYVGYQLLKIAAWMSFLLCARRFCVAKVTRK
jgi:glycosyltransferase involved in cell wall biosynthesis